MVAAAIPQGPRGGRVLGNMREFNSDSLGFIERCAREFGEVVPTRIDPSSAAIERWMGDAQRRRDVAQRSAAYVRKVYSPDVIAQAWVDHYRTLFHSP